MYNGGVSVCNSGLVRHFFRFLICEVFKRLLLGVSGCWWFGALQLLFASHCGQVERQQLQHLPKKGTYTKVV